MIEAIQRERCIGCGACMRTCPLDTLRLDGSGKAYIAYPDDCMTCYRCELSCSQNAIYVHPFKEYLPQPFPGLLEGRKEA